MSAPIDLDELLTRVTAAAGASFPGARIEELHDLPGGHSGLTFAGRLVDRGTVTDVVLKLAPEGRPATGRHDVLRQARLLSALSKADDVRVPRVIFSGSGDRPLFAMSLVAGEAVEPILDDARVPPADVGARAHGAARMLAALHARAPSGLGLEEEPVVTPVEELERWSRTMEAVDPVLRPRGEELRGLLAKQVPEAGAAAVVHGDFRLGNILCEGGEACAVIDWEIWNVGDPRIDLAWFLLFCDPSEFPGASHEAPGMPDERDLLVVYEAVRGNVVDALPWFQAFARFKMAAIMGHNLRRHREGRHVDSYQERLPPTILALVDRGIELMR